jgi:hypothetical protein
MGKWPVLQISDNAGKLHQFLIQVSLALCIRICGESQKDQKTQQQAEVKMMLSEKHGPKIGKKKPVRTLTA